MAKTYNINLGSGDATAFKERYGVDPTQQITEEQRASILTKQGAGAGATSDNFTDTSGLSFGFQSSPVANPTTPVTQPPIGTFIGEVSPTQGTQMNANQQAVDFYKNQFNEGKPIDEQAIRDETAKRYQAQIDAVNAIYADKLREVQIQGEGRLGTGRAVNSRSGLLGSDFGTARNDTIIKGNTDIENSVRAEQNAKIQAILSHSEDVASSVIAEKREAQKNGLNSYLAFLGKQADMAQQNKSQLVNQLLESDIDINEIDLSKIAANYGVSVGEIMADYSRAKNKRAQEEVEMMNKEEDRLLKNKKLEADIELSYADMENKRLELEDKLNKPLTISEGQTIVDRQGNVIYKAPKTYKGGSGTSYGSSGKSAKEIAAINSDLTTAGNLLKTALKKGQNNPVTGEPFSDNPWGDAWDYLYDTYEADLLAQGYTEEEIQVEIDNLLGKDEGVEAMIDARGNSSEEEGGERYWGPAGWVFGKKGRG